MPRPWPVEGIDAETPVDEAAPKVLAVRLAEIAHYRERALRRADPEDVHDLRVATRRLRAALSLLGGPLAAADPGVKLLVAALGAVRDVDVQLEWLERARRRAEAGEAPGIDWLLEERRAALPPLEQAMRAAFERFHAVLEPALAIHLRAAGFPKTMGSDVVRGAVARRLRRVGRRIERLATTEDEAAVHALRIAAKKARYDLELVEPALGEPASRALGRLKALQDLLGELHDRDVRLALLPEWVARAHRDEQPGVVRLLRDALEERHALGARLDEELSRWRKEDEARALGKAVLA